MPESSKYNFVSLCIVNSMVCADGASPCFAVRGSTLVKAPAYKVEIGDMLQFYTDQGIVTGTVEDVVTTDEFSEAYQLISRFSPVFDAVRTFSLNWEAEEGEE